MRKKILILNKHYVPSYKSGGPVRTLEAVTQKLKYEFDFWVICSDRDSGELESYDNVKVDMWNDVDGVHVFYLSPSKGRIKRFKSAIQHKHFNLYYLNSFWNPLYSLLPLFMMRYKILDSIACLVAPRGELLPSAFGHRSYKKRIMLFFGYAARIWERVSWQFSSLEEKNNSLEIKSRGDVNTAQNLSSGIQVKESDISKIQKKVGSLSICYVARIHPHKQLCYVISVLREVVGEIVLNIYGIIDDAVYWDECLKSIESMPPNVKVIYHGTVARDCIFDAYKQSHLMFLPTKGENYGHSIRESLMCACPVLVSDMTPWLNLQKLEMGWDFSLSNKKAFIGVITELTEMTNIDYGRLREKIYRSAQRICNEDEASVAAYKAMFLKTMEDQL